MKNLFLAIMILFAGRLYADTTWCGMDIIGPDWFCQKIELSMYNLTLHVEHLIDVGKYEEAEYIATIVMHAVKNGEIRYQKKYNQDYIGKCTSSSDGTGWIWIVDSNNTSKWDSLILHEMLHMYYYHKLNRKSTEPEADTIQNRYLSMKRLFINMGYLYNY